MMVKSNEPALLKVSKIKGRKVFDMNKRLFGMLLAFMTFTFALVVLPKAEVHAAQDLEGYIMVIDNNRTIEGDYGNEDPYETYIWDTWDPDIVTPYEGISFNSSTATLTIKNVNLPGVDIRIDAGGADGSDYGQLKVKVVGENVIHFIGTVRGGLTFTGKGSLTIDASTKTKFDDGVLSAVEVSTMYTDKIIIEDSVKLKLKAPKTNPKGVIHVYDTQNTKLKDTFICNGIPSKDYTCEFSDELTEWGDTNHNFTITDTSLTIMPVKAGTVVTVSGYKYKLLDVKKKTVSLVGYTVKKSTVKVPDVVEIKEKKYKVTEIGEKAFERNNKVSKVNIGKNVKVIGTQAFFSCNHLSKVECNSKILTTIKGSAFKNDKKLTKMTIVSKKLTKVGKGAFKSTNKNLKVKVPANKVSKYSKLLKKAGLAKEKNVVKK